MARTLSEDPRRCAMSVFDEPGQPHSRPEENVAHGRLSVRRRPPLAPAGRTGVVEIEGTGDGLLALAFVPEPAGERPYRLTVLLHRAGGSARPGLGLVWPAGARAAGAGAVGAGGRGAASVAGGAAVGRGQLEGHPSGLRPGGEAPRPGTDRD